MSTESPVLDALDRLRNALNDSPLFQYISEDRPSFGRLCASMDAIGDAELAILAYLALPFDELNAGAKYLHTYGIFQAMAIQQDAVAHAADAICLPYKPSDELLVVRDVWARAVGSPTKYGIPPNSFGLSRTSLKHDGFTLMSFDLSRPDRVQYVKTLELIAAQGAAIHADLERLIFRLVPPGPQTSLN